MYFCFQNFYLKFLKERKGWWANKQGYQAGFKVFNLFHLNNLYLQGEANYVRPYTYSHGNSIQNYGHYNQSLAHPLGANFQEFICILKYQPAPKWYINARAIYYYQGLDSTGENFGGNPFELYTTRTKDFGYFVGDGNKVKCLNASLALSYELRENLFIEGSYLFRKYTGLGNTNVFNIGIRWNAARREYNY